VHYGGQLHNLHQSLHEAAHLNGCLSINQWSLGVSHNHVCHLENVCKAVIERSDQRARNTRCRLAKHWEIAGWRAL
jgi:hypothetical protein